MTAQLLSDVEIAAIQKRAMTQRPSSFDVLTLLSHIRAMTAENFALAAGQCIVDGGLIGHENGSQICTLASRLAAAEGERDAARKQCDEFCDLAWKHAAAANALQADRDALAAALKPFAKAAEMYAWPVHENDSHSLTGDATLTVGDLRRARAALTAPPAATVKEGTK